MERLDLRNIKCSYHRNGVMGEGFYTFTFTLGRGRAAQDLRAILFDTPGQITVTSDNIDEKFDGPLFEPQLRRHAKLRDEIRCMVRRGEQFDALTEDQQRAVNNGNGE